MGMLLSMARSMVLDQTTMPDSEGKIVVCGPNRTAPDTPNLSPFVLKLETFLRMANIDYVYGNYQGMSSKSKVPWMVCDGTVVEDSEFCISFLKKKFGYDPDENLSAEQKAISRAICKMTEENTYWCLIMFRYKYISEYPEDTAQRFFSTKQISTLHRLIMSYYLRQVRNMAWYQGIGRHTEDEVKSILEGDLRALSDCLGGKPYFIGDEPTHVDCVVFGMLGSMVRWGVHEKNPGFLYLKENCHNLWAYCDRMKARYWPDWDECVHHPQ